MHLHMFSHWFCLRASCHKHAYVDQTLVTLTNFELPRNFWFWMHFYKYCRCHTWPRKCVSISFFIVYFARNLLSQTTHIWIGVPYSLPEVCIFICLLKSNLLRTSCHKPRRYIVCFDLQDSFACECLFSKYWEILRNQTQTWYCNRRENIKSCRTCKWTFSPSGHPKRHMLTRHTWCGWFY